MRYKPDFTLASDRFININSGYILIKLALVNGSLASPLPPVEFFRVALLQRRKEDNI